jgi:hypothetical protein
MNRTLIAFATAFVVLTLVAGCSKNDSPTQPFVPPPATVVMATGNISAKVAEFRTLVGDPANGGVAGEQPAGRREVNWDGAGARPFNNQDHFPPDFFNTAATVGLIYSGASFRNDSTQFVDINPTYANEFVPFSPKVMFSAIGTNVIDASFQVAGAATTAAVNGFGVVLVDVDLAQTTSLELFDAQHRSLGRYTAPTRSDAGGLSFLGVKYDSPIVAAVRITCGNAALAAGVNDLTSGGAKDVVVIDNVIYGEPHPF